MIVPLSSSKDIFKVIFQRAQCLKTFRKYKSSRVLWEKKKKLSSNNNKKKSPRTLKWYISQIIHEKFKKTEYVFIFGWEKELLFFREQENVFDAPSGSYTLLYNCVFHILCSNVNDWRESITCSFFFFFGRTY